MTPEEIAEADAVNPCAAIEALDVAVTWARKEQN
jgi:hypothetical protein